MTFDLPRDRVVPVRSATIRLDPRPHPFERDNADAIAANWKREKTVQPALFNGEVVLLSKLAYAAGRLDGLCHVIRFATFLEWRRSRPQDSAEHAYACAIPVTSDNALIAIRMGSHTSNAGRVYFAGGSFEPRDFPHGVADIDLNMVREVGEETGMDIAACPRDPHYHLRSSDGASVIFRRVFLAETADAVAERISRFVAAEADPEIEEPIVIRGPNDAPDGLLAHMPALLRWHFVNPPEPAIRA